MRFFAKNDGLGSTLKVEYGVASGTQVAWHEIAVLTGTTLWEPTAILPLPQIATETSKSTVWFRFSVRGTSGSWLIDDIYVDPFLNK